MKKFMAMAMAATMVSSAFSVNALAAEPKTAEVSNAKVAVNGEAIAPQAYTINGYTYFKLRDVAKALAGTVAGFGVDWDQEARMTKLTTGTVYKDIVTGETAAEVEKGKRDAHLSEDAVLVNAEEVVFEAYNIDGYNYYKLRDLGEALGFEVTWDKEARMIGINAASLEVEVTESETGAFEYTLEKGAAYSWEDETFAEEVVLICNPDDSDGSHEATFKNCVFEKGLTIISDRDTNVTIDEGCVFAEGTGIVVKEATEGNHLNMTLEDDFVRVYAQVDGLNITTDDIVTVVADGDTTYTLNGEAFSPEVFEEDGPIDGYVTAYYYEDGEERFYTEAWGPEDAAAAAEEEVTEEVEVTEEAEEA